MIIKPHHYIKDQFKFIFIYISYQSIIMIEFPVVQFYVTIIIYGTTVIWLRHNGLSS